MYCVFGDCILRAKCLHGIRMLTCKVRCLLRFGVNRWACTVAGSSCNFIFVHLSASRCPAGRLDHACCAVHVRVVVHVCLHVHMCALFPLSVLQNHYQYSWLAVLSTVCNLCPVSVREATVETQPLRPSGPAWSSCHHPLCLMN